MNALETKAPDIDCDVQGEGYRLTITELVVIGGRKESVRWEQHCAAAKDSSMHPLQ